jgi:hypothetical protein
MLYVHAKAKTIAKLKGKNMQAWLVGRLLYLSSTALALLVVSVVILLAL